MNNNLIITIGRQFGSGGREVGKIVAELLGINYYDKELILEASKASGLCAECFERVDEKAPNRFFNALSMGWLSGASGMPADGWSDDMIFRVQADVIRDIAEKHSAVIVGRCADYILRGMRSDAEIGSFAEKYAQLSPENQTLLEKLAENLLK